MWEYNNSHELYHHGVKGMKWGQHIFGKVKSGAAKIGSVAKKGASAAGTKIKEKHDNKVRMKKAKIPISKLSDKDLAERLKRLELEKRAADLESGIRGSKSKGSSSVARSFIKSLWDQAIVPAVTNSGKNALGKLLDKALLKKLGLNESDPDASLKAEVATMRLKKEKRDLDRSLNGQDTAEEAYAAMKRATERWDTSKKYEKMMEEKSTMSSGYDSVDDLIRMYGDDVRWLL